MLSSPKCKCKAFAVYIRPLEGEPEHATLQDITGHPDLSTKPAQFPSVPVSSANPTYSNDTASSGGMLVKLPIGMIYVANILTFLRHLGSLLNVKSNIVLVTQSQLTYKASQAIPYITHQTRRGSFTIRCFARKGLDLALSFIIQSPHFIFTQKGWGITNVY